MAEELEPGRSLPTQTFLEFWGSNYQDLQETPSLVTLSLSLWAKFWRQAIMAVPEAAELKDKE